MIFIDLYYKLVNTCVCYCLEIPQGDWWEQLGWLRHHSVMFAWLHDEEWTWVPRLLLLWPLQRRHVVQCDVTRVWCPRRNLRTCSAAECTQYQLKLLWWRHDDISTYLHEPHKPTEDLYPVHSLLHMYVDALRIRHAPTSQNNRTSPTFKWSFANPEKQRHSVQHQPFSLYLAFSVTKFSFYFSLLLE